MLPVVDQLPYVDEVPRFWFSRRWRLAFLGLIGFLIVTCQRLTIEVAIISMLNQTTPSAALGSISAANAAGFSRGYWSTRLGSAAPPISGDATPLEAKEFALAYYGGANGTSRQEIDETGRGKTTKKTSDGHDDEEERVVLKNRIEPSSNRGISADGCHNASELAILNTTLFNLHTRGDISWALTEQCGVLDAFYWGDLLIRIPSGFLSQRYGGKRVFGFAMLLSSICTAVIPITSRVHYFAVILLRFITGASVGATIPAMSYLLGRWCPPDERCLLQSIANTGVGVSGSVITIPLIGLLCIYGFDGGWPSAFYISGGLGMLWSIIWMLLVNDSPNDDSRISIQEKDYINSTILIRSNSNTSILTPTPTPNPAIYRWEVALTSLPVFALAVNHFTHEWVVCALMKLIPIYLTDVLHVDFKQNSVGTLVVPSIGFWCVMTMSAGAADRLQAYGVLGVTKIRKLLQTVGAVLTAAMISSILLMNCHHHLAILSLLTLGLSFCGLQYSGALVAHLDVAPGCAGVTMGVVSTLGASVYFVLPPLIQMVLHVPTQSAELKWSIVLLLTASCHIFSALIFLVFGSSSWHSWSIAGHPSLAIDDVTAAEATKTNVDHSAIFDPSHPEFCSSVSNYGYVSNAAPHPHHRQPQYQQQQQSEDVYHEALDPDEADLMDTDSSNRSVTGVQRQTSDDSCSHSCVSAASEISEGFHSSANQPSNSSSGTGAVTAPEADEGFRVSSRPMVASSSSMGNDLSESIV